MEYCGVDCDTVDGHPEVKKEELRRFPHFWLIQSSQATSCTAYETRISPMCGALAHHLEYTMVWMEWGSCRHVYSNAHALNK